MLIIKFSIVFPLSKFCQVTFNQIQLKLEINTKTILEIGYIYL
jgi:hypothetical protein